jgi:hypothetical protein
MNRHQVRKAKLVAAAILAACCQSDNVFQCDLPRIAAHFTEGQWRTVSLAAGVPVVDTDARAMVVALLGRLA